MISIEKDETANVPEDLFAVMIDGLGDTGFYEPIGASIAAACRHGNRGLLWDVLPDPSFRTESSCREHVERLLARNVSGIFFVPGEISPDRPDEDPNAPFLDAAARAGLKVVLVDMDYVRYPGSGRYDVVGIDHFRAGYDQTDHLLRRGCKRILCVADEAESFAKSARLAGCVHALKQAGFPDAVKRLRRGDVRDESFVEALLRRKPDGIACFNDSIAATLLNALLSRRVGIPRDVKIMGLSDARYASLLQVPLSTLQLPCREIGLQALKLMIRLTDTLPPSPRHLYLPTRLIVRESTSP